MTNSSMRLEAKRALVTGAASGIGRAVAVRLAGEGAAVGLMDRNEAGLAETAAEIRAIGGECIALTADVSDEGQVAAGVARLVEHAGGLEIIAGVAGIELGGAGDAMVHELELAAWRRTIDTNLTGMFLTVKHGVKAIIATGGGGSVIITGSPCGLYGFCAAEHAYSASKSGTHGLVRPMAADYARFGIRVNCVIPGFIDTPLNAPVMAQPDVVAEFTRMIPMRRPGQPVEIAPLFAWLASAEASYVTGAFFVADGGHTAI